MAPKSDTKRFSEPISIITGKKNIKRVNLNLSKLKKTTAEVTNAN